MSTTIIILFIALAITVFSTGFIAGNAVNGIQENPEPQLPIPRDIIEYDEETIIKHLNFIIDESIDRYFLYKITPKGLLYINSSAENDMIADIKEDVSNKISSALINQLGLIYNEDYIGTAIGEHIYAMCIERIVDFNVNNQNYNNG